MLTWVRAIILQQSSLIYKLNDLAVDDDATDDK